VCADKERKLSRKKAKEESTKDGFTLHAEQAARKERGGSTLSRKERTLDEVHADWTLG